MKQPTALAGVDIGGTKTLAAVVDRDGTVLGHASAPTPGDGGESMLRTAAHLITSLAARHAVKIAGVGVGAAGVIDQSSGIVTAASESFHDWVGWSITRELEATLGVPVVADNDVNAFVVGELRWGSLAGSLDACGVMLGTGVGGAFVQGGRLLPGSHGGAGEIGHIPGFGDLRCTCGRLGHLETLASGRSIATRHAELTGRPAASAREVAERARGGEPEALEAFRVAGESLAIALTIAGTLLDLTDVVVGGGVTRAWDLLEPSLRQTLDANVPVSGRPLDVRLSALGELAVAMGGAAAVEPLISDRLNARTTT